MNFVHFPKLNDYALEPELVREPPEYGLDITKRKNSKSAHFPRATQNEDVRRRQPSLKDEYIGEDYTSVEPGCDHAPVTTGHSNECPSPYFEESGQAGADKDTHESSHDGIFSSHNSRIQFFRRYDCILLPTEGLDLSDPDEDNSRNVGKTISNQMMTSVTLSEGTSAINGGPSTTDTGELTTYSGELTTVPVGETTDSEHLHHAATLATLRLRVDRPSNNASQPWLDKGHHQKPQAKGVHFSDGIMQVLTNSPGSSAVKVTASRSNTSSAGLYLDKFKRLTLAVVNVLKLAKVMIKRTDSPSALLKTFTALSRQPEEEVESENMKNYGLQFDLSYFRANKEITISSEVKHILRSPPSHRTPEQIQTAMFGLQSLPSFAEYPLHMQEKLAKVAWHEIVTPQRTIIRQGHFAENFYFILSGQAVVTIRKPGETSAQTAAIMRKGTSFGELALLHHSRRTATVTSHDTVQLLSVGREDFFDIFMSGHRTGETPEHIQFISQLDFMKDWPLERLLERPDQCLLHFFKRNTVIVRDSKVSDWFYVVKSGSCRVLKQLKRVNGRLGVPRHQSGAARGCRARHGPAAWPPELRQTPGRQLHRKTRSGELTQPPPSYVNQDPPSEVKDKQQTELPVFVQIELLKPKNVFGLDMVNRNLDSTPPSVSLVSLGAECVMLSKAFFIKHASDALRKRLAEIIQPYPDEDSLQDSLQTKVNWELYKRSLILQVAAHKQTGVQQPTLTAVS